MVMSESSGGEGRCRARKGGGNMIRVNKKDRKILAWINWARKVGVLSRIILGVSPAPVFVTN